MRGEGLKHSGRRCGSMAQIIRGSASGSGRKPTAINQTVYRMRARRVKSGQCQAPRTPFRTIVIIGPDAAGDAALSTRREIILILAVVGGSSSKDSVDRSPRL